MNSAITYGQLNDKLRELGFDQRSVEVYGKVRSVFQHKTIDNAMIVLPERSPTDPVEPFYMASVLATLRANNLVVEPNPLIAQ